MKISSLSIAVVAVLGLTGLIWMTSTPSSKKSETRATSVPSPGSATPNSSSTPQISPSTSGRSTDPSEYWSRLPKPFPVSYASGQYQWTAEDGKDPEVIRKLSNNPEMEERLHREGPYIKRRQLIYLSEDFSKQAQAIYDGVQQEVILPGFDGEEMEVVITSVEHDLGELTGSGPLSGSWIGHIKGNPDATIHASSEEDYWAIALNQDNKNYEYENREHREWILSELDLAEMDRVAPHHCDPVAIDEVGQPIAAQ